MGRKTVYWLSRKVSVRAKQKIDVLTKAGFSVITVPSFTKLSSEFKSKRSLSIMVGDGGNLSEVKDNIQQLNEDPEFGSVRMLLSLSGKNSKLSKMAIDFGFRDILPIDLEESDWLAKYLFAVGLKSDLGPTKEPQLTMQQMATANIPMRISWISSTHIWIESRLTPRIGSNIQLKGAIASQLGLKSLSLFVEKKFNTHLHYRYSEALLCKWSVPSTQQRQKNNLIKLLSDSYSSKPIYVFMGMSSGKLREKIKQALDKRDIHLHLALQKKSLLAEPKYICPDVMILDYDLVSGKNADLLDRILKNLPRETHLIIVGGANDTKPYQKAILSHTATHIGGNENEVGQHILTAINSNRNTAKASGRFYIPSSHPFSIGKLSLSARLVKIRPDFCSLAISHQIGKYSLVEIEAPFFRKKISGGATGKIIKSYRIDEPDYIGMNQHIELSFSSLLADDRKHIALGLVDTLASHYKLPSPSGDQTAGNRYTKKTINNVEYVETPMEFRDRPRAKLFTNTARTKRSRTKRKSDTEIFLSLFSSPFVRSLLIAASVVLAVSLLLYFVNQSKQNPSQYERNINRSFNNLRR